MRATCIGDRIFSCRIDSQDLKNSKEDWRKGNPAKTPHSSIKLPQNIELGLRQMMKYYNLNFGAFDSAVTPEDDYIFFEVNPNGQWAWIEVLTGMPIGKSLADLFKSKGGF